jgi:hypothetical protein
VEAVAAADENAFAALGAEAAAAAPPDPEEASAMARAGPDAGPDAAARRRHARRPHLILVDGSGYIFAPSTPCRR